MKSLFAYSLFALLSPLSLAASEKLRAITSRNVEPVINDYLEIVDEDVVVAVNPDAKGFEFDINPYPKGEFTTPASSGKGYLNPSPDDVEGVHAFRVGNVPLHPDALFRDFFATSKGCGSHCGGPQLVYDQTPDDDSQRDGDWYAYPRPDGGFDVLWYNGVTPLGGDYTVIYLMRENA